ATESTRLAHHWSAAGNRLKEAHYAALAGDQALSVGANVEAKAFFEQALAALAELSITTERQQQFIDVTIKLARVGAYLPSESIANRLQQALEKAATLKDEERRARVLGSTGAFNFMIGRYSDAFNYFDQCVILAEKLGLEELLLLPFNLIGRALVMAGDYPRAAATLARGLPLAEKFNDLELLAGSLAMYATALFFQGQHTQATPYAERALRLAEALGYPSRIAGNLMILGTAYFFCGQLEQAREALTRCLQIAEETQDLHPLYVSYGVLGYDYLRQGNTARATEYIDKSLQLAEAGQALGRVPMYQAFRAELDLVNGHWEEARQRAEAAVALAERTQQQTDRGEACRILGRIYRHAPQSEWEKAEQYFKESITIHQRCNMRPMLAATTFELAKLYLDRGLLEQARATLVESLSLFKELNMSWHLEQARQVEANLIKLSQGGIEP
ncbi:MAG: tetratricopeptide repeat protein, partial [Chloroflexi bacterium]|nr:tetratricopeptide repeat protein [Chloroflexota bacterium]MCI0574788.1 tetratricopeptide repeat protein [Chloroflexota bacterium]MCI0649809.1 tetratricopeptide repeat protein [Chloroflexota bacterium]MCI0731052.1 tetratricopeptide repeat protein [Chloroflexota bacterium]